MNSGETNKKKYKRPKHKTSATTRPETSKSLNSNNANEIEQPEPQCPLLLAKDSEWVDVLQTTSTGTKGNSDAEAVLQLVECEEGAETKPLVLMFPGLLEKDPHMIEGMLNRAMSTSEVTKHLVGQKANFACMKKVNRLIPSDKKWLESVTENRTSFCSLLSGLQNDSKLVPTQYPANINRHKRLRRRNPKNPTNKKNGFVVVSHFSIPLVPVAPTDETFWNSIMQRMLSNYEADTEETDDDETNFE